MNLNCSVEVFPEIFQIISLTISRHLLDHEGNLDVRVLYCVR